MDSIDALVIGAGVVGLAVGRALAQRGLETVVLERANAIGTATSSRNSEVIHAGLYYPSGSLKARPRKSIVTGSSTAFGGSRSPAVFAPFASRTTSRSKTCVVNPAGTAIAG